MDVARIGDVLLVVVDPGMNKLWLVLNNGEYAKIPVVAVSDQSDNSLRMPVADDFIPFNGTPSILHEGEWQLL